MSKPSVGARPSAAAASVISPAHRNDDNDDDSQQLAPVIGARRGSAAGAASTTSASEPIASDSPSSSWKAQWQRFAEIMTAKSTKGASTGDVRAYYKRQRELVNNIMAAAAAQDKFEYHPYHADGSTSCQDHLHPQEADDAPSSGAASATTSADAAEASAAAVPAAAAGDANGKKATAEGDDDEDDGGSFATTGSLILNIILLGLKAYAAVESGSLTVVASLLDSGLDLFSGMVLVVVSCLIARAKAEQQHEYPLGPSTFTAIGTLIFSCVMCIASTKLIEESVRNISDPPDINIDLTTLLVMGAVVISKFFAYLACRSSANVMVEALADDHRNDVISNFVGMCALAAATQEKIVDPIFSLCVVLFICVVWARTAFSQAVLLSGVSASPDIINEITALAVRCDERLVAVDTVRAVYHGDGLTVEVDIVLPPEMTLRDSHDIAEKLQLFLEKCAPGGVEITRAYVHNDYEVVHNPSKEHR